MPASSNQFCDRVGHVMNYGDGVYGGMFVCALYAVAYLKTFGKIDRRVFGARRKANTRVAVKSSMA
jgi:hypothetical protein